MKKKFFAMYALAGALVASPVFTSCIDDTESASVTEVRNQKAEAMRIANQIAAATADLQIQANKLKYEKDIAQYEASIAQYEANLLNYQLQIKENQEALDNFGVVALSTLSSNYTNALSNIATSEWNIVKYNQKIAQLKEDLLDEQAYVAEETARLEAEIAANETQIAEIKKLQEAGLDKSSMDEKIEELRLAAEKAKKDLAELENKYGTNAANTVTGKAMTALSTLGNAQTPSVNFYQNNAEGNPVLVELAVATQQKTLADEIDDAQTDLDAKVAVLGTEADKKDATYYDETSKANVQTLYAALAEAQETYAAAEKAYTEKNDAVVKAEKAVADATTALATETAKGDKADAAKVTELTTAKTKAEEALTAAQTAFTQEIIDAYTAAQTALATAESNVLTAKDAIVGLETTLAQAKEASEEFEAAIAAFEGEDYEAYLAAVAELEAAKEAKTTAETEHTALQTLYSSFNDGVFKHYNWDGSTLTYVTISTEKKIEELENEIENWKDQIADLEAVVEYYYNGSVDVDSEEMLAVVIAHIENLIAIEEAKLAVYNKQAEEAKAALDAYLAEA